MSTSQIIIRGMCTYYQKTFMNYKLFLITFFISDWYQEIQKLSVISHHFPCTQGNRNSSRLKFGVSTYWRPYNVRESLSKEWSFYQNHYQWVVPVSFLIYSVKCIQNISHGPWIVREFLLSTIRY